MLLVKDMDEISIRHQTLNVGFLKKLTSKGTWRQVSEAPFHPRFCLGGKAIL
jgi:hypothetical protein